MIRNITDKFSSGGVWVAALSCTACFPALGALSSALGLSFLSHFEGVAINILLPLFAIISLLVNLFGWYKHKQIIRGILGAIGPIAVLLTLYPLWQYDWSTYLFYVGICLMVFMSILDLVKPTGKTVCKI
jgi:mercuric ion transport protein